jgi:hypothetical protein
MPTGRTLTLLSVPVLILGLVAFHRLTAKGCEAPTEAQQFDAAVGFLLNGSLRFRLGVPQDSDPADMGFNTPSDFIRKFPDCCSLSYRTSDGPPWWLDAWYYDFETYVHITEPPARDRPIDVPLNSCGQVITEPL